MKNLVKLVCIILICTTFKAVTAQNSKNDSNSPIYDKAEALMSNTDTIPDFRSKNNKIKLTGIVYQSDGVTPAKDVIVFIEHADEDGNFDLRREGEERYVFHRSWVKTDADGRYTFYTFVPGNDRRYNRLQEIYPIIKEPSKPEYEIETFLFDEDPLLTKACRKRIAKKSDTTRILKLKTEDNIMVAQRDIVLTSTTNPSK